MGGEKLKLSQAHLGLSALILLCSLVFFAGNFPLAAQTTQPSGDEEEAPGLPLDESAIILGETPEDPLPEGGSSLIVLLRMVLVLALTALAIYGVVFFVKRLARPRAISDPHLKVLARVPLSADSFAAVISLGAKAWLVGGGGGSVSLISEISDAETLESMLIDDARKSAGTGERRFFDFRSLLRKERPEAPRGENGAQTRLFGAGLENGEVPDALRAEALRKQRERLERL